MSTPSTKLVTIGLPIYKRLEYLPHVLKVIEQQDYPAIELLVSDNGVNGDTVRRIVQEHYSRPFRFRQNPLTVEMVEHFNQLVDEALGEYFLLLCDDDEISANFISELVARLDANPNAAIAFSGQEVIDPSGRILQVSAPALPDVMSGTDFILATWQRYQFGFKSVSAYLARTAAMRAVGAYPCFTKGTHEDDAMVVMLALGGDVVLSSRCVWRNRLYESSHGMAIDIKYLAAATREFIEFLDADATIARFAAARSREWKQLKRCLRRMAWQTYHSRWKTMYKKRMSRLSWARAAFALPFIPEYYESVLRALF
jgi:glycosyltransferase involved in cell wall biosynthesis